MAKNNQFGAKDLIAWDRGCKLREAPPNSDNHCSLCDTLQIQRNTLEIQTNTLQIQRNTLEIQTNTFEIPANSSKSNLSFRKTMLSAPYTPFPICYYTLCIAQKDIAQDLYV